MEPQTRPVKKQILIFLAVFVPCVLVWLIICGIGALATATWGSILRSTGPKMNPMWGIAAFGVPLLVLMVGSIRVGIPLIRNPQRASAGVRLMILLSVAATVVPVGVSGFVVARGVWQARERVAAEAAAQVAAEAAGEGRLPTGDEFRARWVGAKLSELVAAVGRPGDMFKRGADGVTYERFGKIARNPVNNRAYHHVEVQVSPDGRIIDVVFFFA